MHHFALYIPREESFSKESLIRRVESYCRKALNFKPEVITLDEAGGVYLVSFQSNVQQYGVADLVYRENDDLVVIWGLPTFEYYAEDIQRMARTEPAKAALTIIHRQGFDSLYSSLGGVFSVVHVSKGRVNGMGSFCGYGALQMGSSNDSFVIGNKTSLIKALLPEEATKPDHYAVSWLLSHTMILGNRTAWTGIEKVPAGSKVYATKDVLKTEFLEPRFWAPPEDSSPKFLDDALDRLIERYRYYLSLPINWSAHITGGKDSRAVVAAALAAGMADKLGKFITNGEPDNGDVLVAELVAKRLGLPHEVRAAGKRSARTEEDLDRAHSRFSYSAWRYEGQLTAWDGAGAPAARRPGNVVFMGGGGEIYRQKGKIFPRKDLRECEKRLKNWYGKYDSLGLLNEHAKEYQHEQMRLFIDDLVRSGARNFQLALYVQHRMNNWGAGHFQSNASCSVASLIDIDLARYAQSMEDCSDKIHFQIINRFCPDLLKVPLNNDKWEVVEQDRQGELVSPIMKNFPWQYDLYQKRGGTIIQEIESKAGLIEPIIDVDALSRLKTFPFDSFNSARLKMVYGARTLVDLFDGVECMERDFEHEPFNTVFRGALSDDAAPTIRNSFSCLAA